MIVDIYGESVDTREEANRPGPYCDGLSVILHGSMDEDDARGDFTTIGTGRRFGRRILWCDTQGFMRTERYRDAGQADAALTAWANEYEDDDDDDEF